ncbi:MAG: amidohydrolase family protein [Deltaproteobacteria bacterium]|nr:amidohydrolase family protein [Deltaproteobacteria bacterium]
MVVAATAVIPQDYRMLALDDKHGDQYGWAVEQAFSFVDTHCHFWDPRKMPCPWLVEVPPIAGTHTPTQLGAEAGEDMPNQIVFVQAGSETPLDEVRWVEELSQAEPRIAAIVAFAPMDRAAETRAALDVLRRHPLVHGVRHLIQGESDPVFANRPEFVAGVQRLGEMGLSFDLCIRHHQLPSVTELVRACPGTSFILDHLGKPAIRDGQLDPWRPDIARLAELPNVVCKISGMVAEADPVTWTAAQLAPYVDAVVRAFGPDRLMFGSDWPVVKIGSGYAPWVRTARALLGSLSSSAQAAIFNHNARRVYRLADRMAP